jgi:SAM-dependent methyltransferase
MTPVNDMNIIEKKPPLFFKAESSIWTDPYIQQNLLDAHLNPDSDAASRNSQAIEATVNFIDEHLCRSSHILDLGCGPGLYASRLTDKGHRVTGVDFNKKAIAYAQQASPENCFIHADYLNDFPAGQYDAVTMIYCDMGTHSDNDRLALLQNCYRALNAGGKLIFDIFSDRIVEDKKEEKTWHYFAEGGFWHPEAHLVLQQTFHYPQDNAFGYQYNLITDRQSQYFLIWERYYSEPEIRQLLTDVGFSHISVKQDLLASNNFTSNREMFIVAEK